jgi:RNA polymerase sigma-70 factor (ECF subfamily)
MSVPSDKKDILSKAYHEHADALFRYCLVKLSSREKSLDAVQEIYMRTWQYLSEDKEINNMKSFLFTVAYRLIIDGYRKKKTDSLDSMIETGFDIDDGNDLPLLSVDAEKALKALHELEIEDKDIMIFRFVNGFGPKEISEVTGLSENVISVRIHRALNKLREVLNINE